MLRKFKRGGLGTLIAVIVLIVMVLGGLVGVSYYYGGITGGATQQANLLLQGSVIKVNSADGSGSVYLKIYNQGPGAIRILSINITSQQGPQSFKLWFGVPTNPPVQASKGSATLTGSEGVNTVAVYNGQTLRGICLVIPAGGSASIYVTFTSADDIRGWFAPGGTYDGIIQPLGSPAVPFTMSAQ